MLEATLFSNTALNDLWATLSTYHLVHLHGHSFQVAGIFYSEYNVSEHLMVQT